MGFSAQNNEAQDIFEAIEEFVLRLDGKWIASSEEREMRIALKQTIPTFSYFNGSNSKLGFRFFTKYQHLII